MSKSVRFSEDAVIPILLMNSFVCLFVCLFVTDKRDRERIFEEEHEEDICFSHLAPRCNKIIKMGLSVCTY